MLNFFSRLFASLPRTLSLPRLALALLALILALYFAGAPALDLAELETYDLRLRHAPANTAGQAVAIVAIDEPSLAREGHWPWSRATLARLVEQLDRQGAKVIAFDIFFSEPENQATLDQLTRLEKEQGSSAATARVRQLLSTDAQFAQAIARSGKVVLPFVFLMTAEEARHQQSVDSDDRLAVLASQTVKAADGTEPAPSLPKTHGVLLNLPTLSAAAAGSGHINALADRDGVIRSASLILRHRSHYYPSADLQAVRLWLGEPALALHAERYGVRGIALGERFIATDSIGRALIRYRGEARSFLTYSASEVLAGNAPAEAFRGKVVLIGATAAGLGDMKATPMNPVFPGVEIRANTIQNLIDNDFIRHPLWMLLADVVLMLVLGVLLAWILPRFRPGAGLAVTAGLAAVIAIIAVAVFFYARHWLNLVYPLALLLVLFITATLYHYFTAAREKREVKRAFQHYVAPAVVNQILSQPQGLALGGEKRELSVLFCDIRGFTALSETLPPETLVPLLNEYLTRMTEQVFRHGGLLDKYIGDAIMAIYGAPLPQPDHAARACRTALDLVRAARTLQQEWKARGWPMIDLGVGINTGPMVVGNMGSKTRFDYTVIGDAVNLASRVEALNKQYGSRILITEFTWQQVKKDFPQAREVDVTTVRGKSEPVRLYELLLPEDYPHFDWLRDYQRALQLFRAGDLTGARTLFTRVADEYRDPVSRAYAARCQSSATGEH
jgi:adenylate cyclase